MYYTDSDAFRNYSLNQNSKNFAFFDNFDVPFVDSYSGDFSSYGEESVELASSSAVLSNSTRDEFKNKRTELAAQKNKMTSPDFAHFYKGLDVFSKNILIEYAERLRLLEEEKLQIWNQFVSAPSESLLENHKKIERKIEWLKKRIKGAESLVARAESCGSFFIFDVHQHKKQDEQSLKCVSAKTCKNRLCPACNMRKARRVALTALAQIASIRKNKIAHYGHKNRKKIMSFENVQCSFLTLTIPNHPLTESRDGYKRFRRALSRMFGNCYEHRHYKNRWISKNILGALAAIEWFGDKTAAGESHLHAHVLLVHDGVLANNNKNYVESVFRRHWQKCYEYDGVLQVNWQCARSFDFNSALADANDRGVVSKNDKFTDIVDNDTKSLLSMVLEVAKYSVTQATLKKMSADDVAELYKQSNFLRQFESYGVLFGFDFPEGETLESVLAELLPNFKIINDDDWFLKAKLEMRYSLFKKEYSVNFIDHFGNTLANAPDLESPVVPFDESLKYESDVPFVDDVPPVAAPATESAEKTYFESDVGSVGVSVEYEIPLAAEPPDKN